MRSFLSAVRRARVSRHILWVAFSGCAAAASACTHPIPEDEAAASESALTDPQQLPLVDTRPWLTEVANPPAAWRRVIAARKDVLRHRFVRFERPSRFPAARARFLLQPFKDTRLVLRIRRAGPVRGVGYSWFGMFENDPHGFGGIVVRPNGRVTADIQTPEGRRFQVANVGNGGYAILEVESEGEFECGVNGEKV